MKNLAATLPIIVMSFALGACSSNPSNAQVDAATGAGAGYGIGKHMK